MNVEAELREKRRILAEKVGQLASALAESNDRNRALTAELAAERERVAVLVDALEAIGGAGYVQPKDAPLLHGEAVDIARAALAAHATPSQEPPA